MNNAYAVRRQIIILVAWISVIFLLSIFWGYYQVMQNPEQSLAVLSETLAQFGKIKSAGPITIFFFIFLNNAAKGFYVIVLGTAFALVPLFFIFMNGQLIGLVLGAAQLEGFKLSKIIAGLAPHGILEIPAIMLAAAYGVWLGYRFFRFVWFKEKFSEYFSFALKKYFTLILPMLFVAALLEAFITPKFLEFFK